MIGHIDAMCKDWGKAKRRIWAGHDGHPTHPKIDGWGQSMAGKIKEEAEGASSGQLKQHFPEVMRGSALDIARALNGSMEVLYFTAVTHYVMQGPAKLKAVWLGDLLDRRIAVSDYWDMVDRLHWYVSGKLDLHTQTKARAEAG